jgi:DNA polymerase-3 subunit alpha
MIFTPLNVKSGYSFFYSALRVEEIVNQAITNKNETVSIIEINSLFTALQINKLANKNKLKTIVGMEVNLEIDEGYATPLLLIAKNLEGYKKLTYFTKFVSQANKEISLNYKEFLDNCSNLLVVTPIIKGFIKNYINDQDKINLIFNKFKGDKVELIIGLEFYGEQDQAVLRYARNLSQYKKVIANEFRYLNKEDDQLLNVLLAIKNNEQINTDTNHNNALNDKYVLSAFTEEEISNHQKLISSINVDVSSLKTGLINYPLSSKDVKPKEYLTALANKGLEKRLSNNISPIYQNRLNYELDLISKMGFENYFLVVWDYVKFAKNNDILVGPGRGSAAGSLVAYTLGITSVDPIKNDLMFERFLNPMRVSLPDIDIDFIDTKRDQVVKYLFEKYTPSHAAHVIAFQTFGVRQSLRDVAKVLGESIDNINAIAKKVPSFNNQTRNMGLKELVENFPSFAEYMFERENYKKIYKYALKLEGLPRQTSYHAAGIVLSAHPLYSFTPVYNFSDKESATQFDMNYLEEIGLLKMDILGLSNLSIIQETMNLVNQFENKQLKISDINIDDPNIYQLISNKLTLGLFQLESAGMNKAIEKIKPSSFEDIVALLALFRPGPMDFIPDYGKRKAGLEKVEYVHDSLIEILKPTYGIIVYQEQITKILQVYAGFDLAEADLVRKAISKKEELKLLEIKQQFITKSKQMGHSEDEANKVYDLILKFANYGFNRAHSVSYAYITVQMAYLKYHHRHAFYTAILNNSNLSGGAGDETFGEYIEEALSFGISLLPPSINSSLGVFSIAGINQIRYSIGKIKGLGVNAVATIINERKISKFLSFEDFCARTYHLGINKKMLEALIDSGAFDEFKINRSTLRNNLAIYIEFAQLNEGLIKEDESLVPTIKVKEYPEDKEFDRDRELEICGIAFTKIASKFDYQALRQQGILSIKETLLSQGNVKMLAMIKSLRSFKTKTSQPMASLVGADENAKIDMILFPKEYKLISHLIETNKYFIIEGSLQVKDKPQFIVTNLSEVK